MRTSFHHQPEAQHPKSSAIHKLPADYPIYGVESGHHRLVMSISAFDPMYGPAVRCKWILPSWR